ncbi:GPI-anchored surface protein, putative [Bodo saltans]|uniref:GPI-anchored surface protein, putative n=1 Tax=Bodo saltans TaxID=75058 RepID=A0A0S4INA6_BODSA|nr:GPI-anchored surface protein, putative [Bodo saltans]|eukprot:CUE83081.1 GPI-anchored surface protein, putative [Bodo saltans]
MSLATAFVLYLLSTLLSTQSTLRRIDAVHDAAYDNRRGKKRYAHEPAATTSEMPFATSPHSTVSRDVSSGERGDGGGGDRRDPNRGLTASSRKRRADVTPPPPPPISSIISNTSGTDTHRRQFPHIEVIVATSSSLTSSSSPVYSLPAEMVAASLVEFDVEETRRALQASIDHFIVWNRPTGTGGSASVALSPAAAEDRIHSALVGLEATRCHFAASPHDRLVSMPKKKTTSSSSPVYSLPAEVVAASLVEFDVQETRRALQASIDHFIVWNRPTGSGGSASVVLSPAAAEDRIHTALVGLEATRCRFAASPHDRLVSMPRAGIALLMALFLSTLFSAVSIGVFDKLQNGELHCGADYCTSVLGVLAGNPCGRGPAYRSFLAGTIMSGISLFIGLVLAIVFHRPVRAATEFTDQFYVILTNVCSEREEELRALQVSLEAARAAGPRPPPPTALDGRSSVRRGGSTVYVPPTTSSHSVISGTVLASDYERDNLQRQEESPPPSARPSQERNVASAAGASFADLSKNAFSAGPSPPQPTATLSSSGSGPSPTDRSQRAFSGGRLDEPGWVFAEEEQLFYHAGSTTQLGNCITTQTLNNSMTLERNSGGMEQSGILSKHLNKNPKQNNKANRRDDILSFFCFIRFFFVLLNRGEALALGNVVFG